MPEKVGTRNDSFMGKKLAAIAGLVGAVAVDLDRGSIDGVAGRGSLHDLELAAIHDGEVLDRVREVAALVAPGEELHSVVITVAEHHYAILPSRHVPRRYLYLVIERGETALGLLLLRLNEAGAT